MTKSPHHRVCDASDPYTPIPLALPEFAQEGVQFWVMALELSAHEGVARGTLPEGGPIG